MTEHPEFDGLSGGCWRVAVGAVSNGRGGYEWADLPAVVLLPSQSAPDQEPETRRCDVEFWAVYAWYERDNRVSLCTVRDQAGGPSALPFSAVWNLIWCRPWGRIERALSAWKRHTGGVGNDGPTHQEG